MRKTESDEEVWMGWLSSVICSVEMSKAISSGSGRVNGSGTVGTDCLLNWGKLCGSMTWFSMSDLRSQNYANLYPANYADSYPTSSTKIHNLLLVSFFLSSSIYFLFLIFSTSPAYFFLSFLTFYPFSVTSSTPFLYSPDQHLKRQHIKVYQLISMESTWWICTQVQSKSTHNFSKFWHTVDPLLTVLAFRGIKSKGIQNGYCSWAALHWRENCSMWFTDRSQ